MNVKRGFGTNFHGVYGEKPDVYHEFSSAEVFSKELEKRMLSMMTGDTMLDIACGTCHKTHKFSKKFKKVFALDKSHALLEKAKAEYGENAKLNFLCCSADNIPLLDNSIDTIVITWGSFPLTKTLREIDRVLKPGGTAMRIGIEGKDEFTELFPKLDIKRVRRIQKQFRTAGFNQESFHVDIQFSDIQKAKEILSQVTGSPKPKIKKNNYVHNIVLHSYTKKAL